MCTVLFPCEGRASGSVRGSEARWYLEGCNLVRHGYERKGVGKCARIVAHVREIEYFCDERDAGDGRGVQAPYV